MRFESLPHSDGAHSMLIITHIVLSGAQSSWPLVSESARILASLQSCHLTYSLSLFNQERRTWTLSVGTKSHFSLSCGGPVYGS